MHVFVFGLSIEGSILRAAVLDVSAFDVIIYGSTARDPVLLRFLDAPRPASILSRRLVGAERTWKRCQKTRRPGSWDTTRFSLGSVQINHITGISSRQLSFSLRRRTWWLRLSGHCSGSSGCQYRAIEDWEARRLAFDSSSSRVYNGYPVACGIPNVTVSVSIHWLSLSRPKQVKEDTTENRSLTSEMRLVS